MREELIRDLKRSIERKDHMILAQRLVICALSLLLLMSLAVR